MPYPKEGESKDEFISRFMSSEEAKKDYPKKDRRLAVANSIWERKSKNKETSAFFTKVKIKENEEEEDKLYTFIGATTLPDRAREMLPDGEVLQGEILSKTVLDKIANAINDESILGGKYGSYRTVSLFHDRVYSQDGSLEEAGFIKPGSAVVKELEKFPGNYGLFVDVEVNKMYKPSQKFEDYTSDKIKYKIDKGVIGLSLEYQNEPHQEKIVDVEGAKYRYVFDSDDYRGFSFARANVIGNPMSVRVKEITLAEDNNKNNEVEKMSEEEKNNDVEKLSEELSETKEKVEEIKKEVEDAKKAGDEAKVKEMNAKFEEVNSKLKELKLKNDATATKLKESIELAFSNLNISAPARVGEKSAKVKEVYNLAKEGNWTKFKEVSNNMIRENESKIKELMARDGPGYDFEKYQTLKVKCAGSQMIVVPSAKTKDVIDSDAMAESTYYQTNAMFADRYVSGITETFLKEDSLLTAMNKEQYIGGNDKYQWKIWVDYETVTGDSTLAVDPDNTSVARSKRSFIKLETPIREYRDGVEVTDFTQYHSMGSVGSLMDKEIQRAAEAVVESMNADLFKENCDATTGWVGFNGLQAIADSTGNGTIYGKVRSAANRLLDGTLANTYVSTSEAISVSGVRTGYEKVLAHGSSIGSLAIVIHPTQCRLLFDSEDAAIRNNILTMSGAPPTWGFNRSIVPHLDGIPMIRDYRCESSAGAADMFVVVDMSSDKGFNLIVSKPLGIRGLAKVGTSDSAYVNFWGCTVYKSPRNIFLHDSLTT